MNIDQNKLNWGFTQMSELYNGRLAMLGIVIIIAVELFTSTPILRLFK